MPCCPRQDIGRLIWGHLSTITWTLLVDYETERLDRTVVGFSRHPSWHIYRWLNHHFTPKQGVQARPHLFGRKPENHALAAASPIKSEHQSGLVWCSSKPRHPKAECPVPTSNSGYSTFGELTCRFPEKGAVAKEPNVPIGHVRQDALYCDAIIVIGHVDCVWNWPCILNNASGPSHEIRCERHLPNDSRHNRPPQKGSLSEDTLLVALALCRSGSRGRLGCFAMSEYATLAERFQRPSKAGISN
jgi:hypothetical protein